MLDILGISMKAGNFYRVQVKATEELIEITDKIRERCGYTDLVGTNGANYDYEIFDNNDVYYTHYLGFNINKRKINLFATVAHGEKDDFAEYEIQLLPEEKEMLMWKVIKALLDDVVVLN